MKKIIIILFLFWILSSFAKDIVIFQTDIRYAYRIELLKLVLAKGDPGQKYEIKSYSHEVNYKRGLKLIEDGKVDIGYSFVDGNIDNKFRVINYPILQGILGYRIFLINSDSKYKWNKEISRDSVRRGFVAGFVGEWRDFNIMKDNGIIVEDTGNYKNLFPMLMYDRFDYIPRGINEVWGELERFKKELPNITIEENYAFYYPFPVNYFVNKSNDELAKVIEAGLRTADADGSLRKLFLEFHSEYIKKSNLNDRKIIQLKNRHRIYDVPNDKDIWWLKN